MKKGLRHKTGAFGKDSEHYVGRLFMMARHPNGNSRPDLISVNGRYRPKLSIEVKSGINGKVSLCSYQLHYGLTCEQDYEDIFGEKFDSSSPQDLIPVGRNPFPHSSPVAYYYNLVSRSGEVASSDLDTPWSPIKLRWGRQVIVPHEFIFWTFALARYLGTSDSDALFEGGEEEIQQVRIDNIVSDLRKEMQDNMRRPRPAGYDPKAEGSWESMYVRDMVALSTGNFDLATKYGRVRLELLLKYCEEASNFRNVVIPGPNETEIRVLAKPEHYGLFDDQLRATVDERRPVLETLIRSRARAVPLLARIKKPDSLYGGQAKVEDYDLSALTLFERERLKRAVKWAPRGEPLELEPAANYLHESRQTVKVEEVRELDENDLPEISVPDDGIAF